jgi:hypothetical protein
MVARPRSICAAACYARCIGHDGSYRCINQPAIVDAMTGLRIPAFTLAALLAGTGPAAAQTQDQRLVVINGTDTSIEFLYFAACGGGAWGKDRLGAKEVIEPGARRQFSIRGVAGGCCYDLRAKLVTGASRQKLNVDVCRDPEWLVR